MWSKEQLQAINTYNKNILVAAAAGSGKTSVLVERVIQHIVNKHCDINQILVVTFTNAAAAEMRERIGKALTQQLSDKDKERQLVLLNAASISTLHSFCQNIIRQNFHQIDLDPKFRLATQQEIDLLKIDVLDELFETKYEQESDSNFLQFTDTYGNERGDENIYNIILKLYEYSRSQPFSMQWLAKLPTYFELKDGDLNNCPWLKIIKDGVIDALEIGLNTAQNLQKRAKDLNLPYYVNLFADDIDAIDNLLEIARSTWQEIYEAIGKLKFKRMVPPKDTPADIKDQFKLARDEMKKGIMKLRETYLIQTFDDVLEDMPILYAQASTLCQVTSDFATAFARAKKEKSIVDFSDLEHFTLQILADKSSTIDNLIPTPVAQTLQAKFTEIMVDEYQDTNGVQEAILKLIASQATPNLFFVGDVKQSIYKFRLAEPELFLQKYNTYPKTANCVRIDLTKNFRSRAEIIDGINFVFSQIMTEKAAELPYGKAEALCCGFDYPQCNQLTLQSPIELTLIAKDEAPKAKKDTETGDNLQGFFKEAGYIVQRLKKLKQDNPFVFDKATGNYRPIKWRDIVILLRSVQDKATILAETLRDADIPVYASIETGYFEETEVRIMISLLQIIDNPQQDIPLTAVLYSPIINLSLSDLAAIRLADKTGNMYTALQTAVSEESNLKASLKNKLQKFLNDLDRWRDYARRHSVPELIWLLLNETGYYDYAGGMPEGLIRQANLRALYDRAAAYEQTSFRGLFRFLRFVHKMRNAGNDLAVARSLGEGEDVVRIMSIHKSKGLEFPVVILADTGKQFNLKDAQNPVLFHKKLGLGLYRNDVTNHISYQTLSRQAISRQIIHEYKAEEMRVLYVAMTRAREKLIITGSVRSLDKFAQNACSQLAVEERNLPDYFIEKANSYLDWLGATVARHQDGQPIRKLVNANGSVILKDNSHWQVDFISELAPTVPKVTDEQTLEKLTTIQQLKPLPITDNNAWVNARLNWQYPYQAELDIPAKLSVTEIKRRFASEVAQDDSSASQYADKAFKRPQFIQQTTAITNVEYGTLMHTIMQHLDLQGDLSDNGIQNQLELMAKQEIITATDIERIYRKSIRDFLFSPIGTRLRNAKSLYRELAFNRILTSDDKYIKELYPHATKNNTIFIQGIIDLLFEEDDGLVLLDYKTDNCDEITAKQKYATQIDLYAQAAKEIMRQPIKEKYLYLFHTRTFVKM